jgi:hypothetical protein
MLLIYTPQITERIAYTFALFFEQMTSIEYCVTDDIEEFENHSAEKFSYGPHQNQNVPHIQSVDFLLRNDLIEIELKAIRQTYQEWQLVGFFETPSSPFAFDIFASAFYLVSRYEEYISARKDSFGRFVSSESAASRFGFLAKPMVNYYALCVARWLQTEYSKIDINYPKFSVLNTIDVDMSWKYKEKGIVRNLSGMARDIFNLKLSLAKERIGVLLFHQKDPFDSFDYLIHQQQEHGVPLCFFWLLGKYSTFDKNISPSNKHFRSLIKRVSEKGEVGIHFSHKGHKQKGDFELEKKVLEDIVGQTITKNRFHFLKFDIAHTFYKLIQLGIKEEYSMGYSSHSGFRASIATPYFWFDLKTNQPTTLLQKPLVFMDATIRYHHHKKDEDVIAELNSLLQEVKNVNGQFIALWHNDIFDDKGNDWKTIFEWFNAHASKMIKR